MNAVAYLRDRALPWCLGLYAVSLLTSMAAMELFSSLSALIVATVLISNKKSGTKNEWIWYPADWALLALFFVIGSARFIFLFYLLRQGLFWSWSETRLAKMMNVLVVVSCVVALYALIQYYTGADWFKKGGAAVSPFTQRADGSWTYRATGFFDHPLRYSYSVGMAMCFPLAYALTLGSMRRRQIFMAIGTVVMTAGLFATLSRGSWLAVAVAFLVMVFYINLKRAVAAVSVLVVAVGLMVAVNPDIVDRVKSAADTNSESTTARFQLWRANWQMFLDHPVLGVGYNQNEPLAAEYFDKMGVASDAFKGHAHSNYFQFLSSTGLTGFLLYMFFVGFYLFITHRALRVARLKEGWLCGFVLGAMGAQIVMHIGGLTECTFKGAQLNHLFMFTLAGLSVATIKLAKDPSAS